jgi:hypothetical protein
MENSVTAGKSEISDLIRKKKEKKKAKQEKLLASLDQKKRSHQDKDDTVGAGGEAKRSKKYFESIFDAQKEEVREARDFTVSVALPGSILDNAQSVELRTYLAGQIARAFAVFNIDEVIVFSDDYKDAGGHGDVLLPRILQFLECPQYLRKHFFPIHQVNKVK